MILRFALLTLLFSVLSFPCYADFTLVPGVDLSIEYNDNIFLDSDNEEDDVITRVSPNILLEWETSRLDISLFASVAMEKYLDNTDEDRIGAGESDQSSTLTALARLYRDVFFLNITDTYARVPIDEGGRGGEGNTTVNLTDSNTLRINPYLNLPIMKDTFLRLGYTYTNVWYEEDDADDAQSHLYSASLTRTLSPRITATLSGSYKEYRPKDADKVYDIEGGGSYDYDEENLSFSLSYQVTERLHLQGSYGHTWLDYDVISANDSANDFWFSPLLPSDVLNDSNSDVLGDTDSDVWSASADYEISSDYTVGTAYSKSYTVSVDDGPSKSDRLSAYIEYDKRFMVNFSIFTTSSSYVEIDRDDDSYGGALSGELPLNDRIGITGLLSYENFDRTGLDEEEFNRYASRFSLYYETRLGRVSTGYTFNRTDYDQGGEDYYNNIVFISASLRF